MLVRDDEADPRDDCPREGCARGGPGPESSGGRGSRAFLSRLPNLTWIEDENDPVLATCFSSEDGGWLTGEQDTEFWSLVASTDPGADGEAPPEQLVTLLEQIVAAWDQAWSHQSVAPHQPRYLSVEAVAGWPNWWQGYDSVDQAWKYVQAGEREPDDATTDWELAETAFAPARAEVRFEQVQMVPGDAYPGWWQAYDRIDGAWKYAHGPDRAPTGRPGDWTTDLVNAAAQRTEPAADSAADLAQQPPVALLETVATAIAEIRDAGVTEDEMSDAEIIDVLQESMRTEMASS